MWRRVRCRRGYPFLAFMSMVIIKSIEDVLPFGLVLFSIMLLFSAAFAKSNNGHHFDFLSMYGLMLGDFDLEVCRARARARGDVHTSRPSAMQ